MILSVGGVGNGWAFGARVLHSLDFCMLALLQRWERHCAAQASLSRTQNCATPT